MPSKTMIRDLEIKYEVEYRPIRFPRLEFKTGNLKLILPVNQKNEERILEKHKDWIYQKHREIILSLEKANKTKITKRSPEEFRKLVEGFVEKEALRNKTKVNNIFFRKMKTKWASCSPNKNLTVNTELRHLPKNLIEYVLVHEMTHLKERKHDKKFWNIIQQKYKNPERQEKQLLTYWFLIQKRTKPPSPRNPFNISCRGGRNPVS